MVEGILETEDSVQENKVNNEVPMDFEFNGNPTENHQNKGPKISSHDIGLPDIVRVKESEIKGSKQGWKRLNRAEKGKSVIVDLLNPASGKRKEAQVESLNDLDSGKQKLQKLEKGESLLLNQKPATEITIVAVADP